MEKPTQNNKTIEAECVKNRPQSARRQVLTLDTAMYQSYLDDIAIGDADKAELIKAIWGIIVGFVDLGFSVVPEPQSCGQLSETAEQGVHDAPPALDSGQASHSKTFKRAAHDGAERALETIREEG